MATILHAFVSTCANRLATLVEEQVVLILDVKDELKRLQRRIEMIIGVLEDAERRRIQDSAIDTWLNELKNVMYEADDIIDICRYKGGNLLEDQPSSSSNPPVRCLSPLLSCVTTVRMRHDIGGRIKRLNNRLEEIHKDKVMFSLKDGGSNDPRMTRASARLTSPLLDADVVGDEIEAAAAELVRRTVSSKEGQQHQVVAIVGMAGIGKTTLAQRVYNDPKLKNYFSVMVWTCVSRSYSAIELVKKIIRSSGGDYGRAESMEELQQVLRVVVAGKRLFLVLDDVWQSDVWTNLLRVPLQSELGSGRILITTRDRNVAKGMGAVHIHEVTQLSINSGWELLRKRAYLDREEDVLCLRGVGIQIVKKCGGLPLAIKAIAGILATKEPNKREWEKLLGSDAWSMKELPEELRGALYLSYEDLSPELKQCFLYCSLYPEDALMRREHLNVFWVAEGFVKARGGDQVLEDTAEEYYNELVKRSLLQLDPNYTDGGACRMHDLLRSLAQYLSRSESFYGDPQLLDPNALSKIYRLSIANDGAPVVIPPSIDRKRLCLRTLLLFKSPSRVKNDLFIRLTCLRVLVLNGEGVESIPESLGDLIHLRMLDLADTRISKLPNSLGCLTNLHSLNVMNCKHLHALPMSFTRLCNLRHLGINYTPLNDVPKGIERLQLLTALVGFVVASKYGSGKMQDGWELKEIEFLDQLKWLHIVKLERATYGFSLERKHCLRILELRCTLQEERACQRPYSVMETNKIEEIFEKLSPPLCLENLIIIGFFGRRYPTYMGTSLSSLTSLQLWHCISCPHLPPLGQLPHLRNLRIEGALAVVTISREFLGKGVRTGLAMATAFPKLEFLFLKKMPNWEEWHLCEEIEERATSTGRKIAPSSFLSLMPCLKHLTLIDCPKLRGLPERLKHATMLQRFHIEGAHSLRAVENLPSLTQWLQIIESSSIQRVSNLPQLRHLTVIRSPSLSCVQNLDALQSLYLKDESMECLPEWVSGLLQQRRHLHGDDLEFEMECNIRVLERCQMGHQDWPVIQQFSNVHVYTNYVEYVKLPFNSYINLTELRGRAEEETEEGIEE
ncbi:putative disease resistance protein RGA3 isoform X1 [Typha angustifolia]|uniref:putative disease resistance protein RGA3 isoform X1 n=1 Tax=Typha angustifolia TaxID=59011 RepID=UPI003C2C445E